MTEASLLCLWWGGKKGEKKSEREEGCSLLLQYSAKYNIAGLISITGWFETFKNKDYGLGKLQKIKEFTWFKKKKKVEWSSVYVSVCCKEGLYQWGQGSWSWPRGNFQHNLDWTWRQEAAAAKLEVSAGDLLTRRLRDLFNSSLPISHTGKLAHMCRNRAHKHARLHTRTQMGVKKNMRLHNHHTQAHTQATAEWSQLERHRHFGLSTARISGQVRTTHIQVCSFMQLSVVFFSLFLVGWSLTSVTYKTSVQCKMLN